MRTKCWYLLVVFAFGCAVACSGKGPEVVGQDGSQNGNDATNGNGSPGRSVDSDVSDDKGIQSLDTSQKKEVCRAGQEYVLANLSKDVLCRWVAHYATAFQGPESTEEARQLCKSTKSECQSSEEQSDVVCEEISGGDSCSVTVGQWEDCEEALADTFIRRARESPQCSEVELDYYTTSDSDGGSGEEEPPDACESLANNCESFYKTWVGPDKTQVTSN